MSAVNPDAVLPTVTAGIPSVLIRWRKLLLRRQAELSFVCESFEKLWKQYFQQHPVTLQLNRPAQSKAESYWQCESWKKAAHWDELPYQYVLVFTPPAASAGASR